MADAAHDQSKTTLGGLNQNYRNGKRKSFLKNRRDGLLFEGRSRIFFIVEAVKKKLRARFLPAFGCGGKNRCEIGVDKLDQLSSFQNDVE